MILSTIAFIIFLPFLAFYIYFKWSYTFWKKRNVPELTAPSVPFGTFQSPFSQTQTIAMQAKRMYDQFKAKNLKMGGLYMFHVPMLFVVDRELLKSIMTKDFNHFTDHFNYINEDKDPLTGHLVMLKGNKWRNLRAKLTPMFTSGKMKMMFNILIECSEGLGALLDAEIGKGGVVEIKDALARYTTDAIGSCAFGLDCNCLLDPDSEFRKYGKRSIEASFNSAIVNTLAVTFPKILDYLKIPIFEKDLTDFFVNLVKSTIEHREKNNIVRKDFIQLMMELKDKGFVADDEHLSVEDSLDKAKTEKPSVTKLTYEEIAAQAFVFLIAGFETSSTTLTFCFYEIALNQRIQEQLREEVHKVLNKHGGKLTYEALTEMTYMDQVISETLRKWPPLAVNSRECTKTYRVPDTDLVLEKGDVVILPAFGFHRDPEYYPNPDNFDPDRFSPENQAKRPSSTWLPFGEGPRTCIGMRFGLMQMKVALAVMLRSYRFTINLKTIMPLELDPKIFLLSPVGGVWTNIEKLSR